MINMTALDIAKFWMNVTIDNSTLPKILSSCPLYLPKTGSQEPCRPLKEVRKRSKFRLGPEMNGLTMVFPQRTYRKGRNLGRYLEAGGERRNRNI